MKMMTMMQNETTGACTHYFFSHFLPAFSSGGTFVWKSFILAACAVHNLAFFLLYITQTPALHLEFYLWTKLLFSKHWGVELKYM